MKIVIDLTSLSYHLTGIERYAACITEQMLKQDKENYYYLIFRNEINQVFNPLIDNKRINSVVLRGSNKLIFFQVVLPWHLYRIKADKYLFFAFTSPILFRKKGIINTIHDMGAWDSSSSMRILQKIYWRITIRCSAGISERIITVSEFSKERINKLLSYPENRIEVVYSAVYEGVVRDYGYTFQDIKETYHLPDKYIMTLSTLEPRKNMTLLLQAFTKIKNEVDYDLVLIGRKGWKMDAVLEKYNTDGRVHITGFVSDEHISVIYKNALCFVFPSLYEGFGLPPVEALSLGTPVLASDAASIPEVLREQAIYFPCNNIKKLEELLSELNSLIFLMPHSLDEFQKRSYCFEESSRKVLKIVNNK